MSDFIEETLVTHILGDSGITALIGDRIYPVVFPQDTPENLFPALRYQVVSDAETYTMDGDSGLDNPRVQIDSYALEYSVMKNLSLLVRKRMSGFRGTVSGKVIQGIFLDGERDLYESVNELVRAYRRSQDYTIWHEQNL